MISQIRFVYFGIEVCQFFIYTRNMIALSTSRMKYLQASFYRTLILFILISGSSTSYGQDSLSLGCADVRNGTFYYFDKRTDGLETFIRKGAMQREIIAKQKEAVLWDVEWLNDCVYTLKYESGAENHPAAEQKFLAKHIVVTEILQVHPDYLTFRSAMDKVTNPTVLSDTLWIRQRQSARGKPVTNPRADSLMAKRNRAMDSLEATYATLYVFRPGKALNSLMNYNLLINGEPACVISNGCREILKLHKAGTYRLSAKVYGPEQVVTLEVRPGESYYLQCMITWGLASHPVLTLLDKTVGEGAFKTAEKEGLWHRE